MAAKFFTGLPLDGPDPECVLGHGERLLAERAARDRVPRRRPTTRAAPAPRRRVTDARRLRRGRRSPTSWRAERG